MVAWSRVLLLEAGLVLLIYNNQSKAAEGEEDATAHPHDDVVGMVGEHLLIHLHALCVGVAGMIDTQPVAEDPLQALGQLGGENYLGEHVEHLPPLLQLLLYEVDIDFGLAAAGDSVQQAGALLLPRCLNLVHRHLLCIAQGMHDESGGQLAL